MSRTKEALNRAIDIETRWLKSKTVAYQDAAKSIGKSESWVRKYLSGDLSVAEPRERFALKIALYYATVCETLEKRNAEEQAENAELRKSLHASLDNLHFYFMDPA